MRSYLHPVASELSKTVAGTQRTIDRTERINMYIGIGGILLIIVLIVIFL